MITREYKIWLQWWMQADFITRTFPLAIMFLYWIVLGSVGGLRNDLVIASSFPVLLYYGGPRLRSLYYFSLPFFLTSILYDSQRYFADSIRGPIHVKEPYDIEKRLFGIRTAAGVLTPNEWWELHTYRILDFFTGLAYIIFIPVYIACAAYFQFWLGRKGTETCPAWAIRARAPQLSWAFLWVNLIGWTTYYWYAASPPWYVAQYGFGPARLDIPAGLAGCVRFDALVGLPVFAEFYGHAADIHGAIPSLHVSYPFMAIYYAFRFGALKKFTIFFYCLMCFSAVYLNHHYVIDVVIGTLYGAVVAFAVDMIWNYRMKQQLVEAY